MYFERQKQVTDEYRKRWDEIWGNPERYLASASGFIAVNVQAPDVSYANGCPILEDATDDSKWHVENTPFGLVIADDSVPPNEIRMSDGRQIVRITNLEMPK